MSDFARPPWLIAVAETPEAIARCHAVMRQLRPQFDDEAAFVARVQLQIVGGYRLTSLESDGAVRAVAGWRILEMLHSGRTLYVDDLVSAESARARGYGGNLVDWLVDEARRAGCDHFSLDSGVQRFNAHRFYLRKGMNITSHHFAMPLDALRRERA